MEWEDWIGVSGVITGKYLLRYRRSALLPFSGSFSVFGLSVSFSKNVCIRLGDDARS